MENLLQRLWDAYSDLVTKIDNTADDVPLDADMQRLIDSIIDTGTMRKLRKDLYDAGVQNIPGINYP